MRKLRTGDVMTVNIDRLSIGGRGVTRHEGLVIFVPDSAPGDILEIKLSFVKKNFAEGRIERILTPSLERIQPPCPVAGVCGGCSWQHISYAEQLKQKHALVIEALRKFSGHFDPLKPELLIEKVSAVVPSPSEFRYRNRIQLHHAPGVRGAHLGFYKRGTRQIVDITSSSAKGQLAASSYF
jgi:23S rRNA (uracil1939-C5)-methyltransferase